MRKYLTPIYVVLFLIGATALWYFGHHRPAQKILEAEPKKIYKSTPLPPKGLSVKPVPSDAIQEPREADTDIAVEDIDNAAMSKKIDDSQSHSEAVDSEESMPQEALLTKDAAAEAYEKYLTAEADYQAAQERLKQVFPFKDTDHAMSVTQETEKALAESDHQAAIEGLGKVIVSLESIDRDQIRSAVEAFKEAKLRRNEALENLAAYSENAAEMLAQVKEAERQENEARIESERRSRELRTQLRNLQDSIEELEKSQ
ncbi:hypothetical protein J5I95_03820 [Candidatus Poribacteria bacterium]|nr:hypothetical protein [Candidatus Poribacteria bacterium]